MENDPQAPPPGPTELHDPSRRAFLAHSALFAGAAAALSGCRTSGSGKLAVPRPGARAPLADGEPVRIGVIGVGGMGGEHVGQLSQTRARGRADVELVAIADPCSIRLGTWTQRAADLQGLHVDGYADHRALLARRDVHGVLIATPEHQHASVVLDAIAAGKDVYCEKPMTRTLDEALVVEEAVRRAGTVFQTGSQFVMQPKYAAARELVRSGAIGKPTLTQCSYCRNSKDGEWLYKIWPEVVPGKTLDWEAWLGGMPREPWDPELFFRWRRFARFSGGVVADLLVHPITPLLTVVDAGWPVRVHAAGGRYVHRDMDNPDSTFLTIELERGHTLIAHGSTCNELGIDTIVRGHKGNLKLGGKDVVLVPEATYAAEVEARTVECAEVEDQDLLRVDWLSCIRTRERTAAPAELGLQVMVIVDLAVRSLADGRAWEFDPETREAARA